MSGTKQPGSVPPPPQIRSWCASLSFGPPVDQATAAPASVAVTASAATTNRFILFSPPLVAATEHRALRFQNADSGTVLWVQRVDFHILGPIEASSRSRP